MIYLYAAWARFCGLPAWVHWTMLLGACAWIAYAALWLLLVGLGILVAAFLGGLASAALEIAHDKIKARRARQSNVARTVAYLDATGRDAA